MTGVSRPVSLEQAQRIAVDAALLSQPLPATPEGILDVARHFGGIQIDPTRTVERTQHLVLWSRIPGYNRDQLERVLAEGRAFEYNAFIMTFDRVPELVYYAQLWPDGKGTWRERTRNFLDGNAEFRQSILDQLRAEGPLASRQIDTSKVKIGWTSTGWTQGNNASQMLEFMSVKLDVAVAGRVGQERLWDLGERVIPAIASGDVLTKEEYDERRVMRAMTRFGVATQQEIRLRAYGLSILDTKALLARLVEQGRLIAVDLPYDDKPAPAFALPEVLETADPGAGRTTLLSPFDPLIYDRDRTERLFGFSYRLEMYKPKAEREFGHFVLPILHGSNLVGRLDSERDRKANELIVRKLHWEEGANPDASTRAAVDAAIDNLKEFVRLG